MTKAVNSTLHNDNLYQTQKLMIDSFVGFLTTGFLGDLQIRINTKSICHKFIIKLS